MKIGPLESKPAAAPAASERKAPAATAGQGAQPSAHVALSPAATALAGGTDAADGSFDSQKVERIAQAIKDGKFKVNPEAIADKLIANARELLGKNAN
ncbi:MAG: flagellar biosynthesis anti-sigma factor FlgM [Rubrivivax sp.]